MAALIDHPVFFDGATANADQGSSSELLELSAPEPLVLTERRLRGCAVLSVRGEIDIATVAQLDRAATRLLADAGGRLVLDLSGTSFMDLSGVRAVERLSRLAAMRAGGFAVVAVTCGVRRVLALAAHQWLTVTADLPTALEAVGDRRGGTVLAPH
jgi:anti-anti-sigma factor